MTQLEKNHNLDDFDNSNLSDVDVKMMINELDGGGIDPERVRKYESEGYFDYQVSLLYVTLDTKRDNKGKLSKKEQKRYDLLSNHMITFNKGFDQIVYEKKKKEIESSFQGLLKKAENGDEVAQKQLREYNTFTYNVELKSDGELYERFGGPRVYTYTKEGKSFYYILPFVSYSSLRDKDTKMCDPLQRLVKNGIDDEEKTDYINNNRLTMGKFEELLATAQ